MVTLTLKVRILEAAVTATRSPPTVEALAEVFRIVAPQVLSTIIVGFLGPTMKAAPTMIHMTPSVMAATMTMVRPPTRMKMTSTREACRRPQNMALHRDVIDNLWIMDPTMLLAVWAMQLLDMLLFGLTLFICKNMGVFVTDLLNMEGVAIETCMVFRRYRMKIGYSLPLHWSLPSWA